MSTKKVTIGGRPSKSKAAAAEQWIKTRETARADEEPLKRMTFDMPESLHKALKLYCVEHGTKMSNVLRELIEQLLKKGRG